MILLSVFTVADWREWSVILLSVFTVADLGILS